MFEQFGIDKRRSPGLFLSLSTTGDRPPKVKTSLKRLHNPLISFSLKHVPRVGHPLSLPNGRRSSLRMAFPLHPS